MKLTDDYFKDDFRTLEAMLLMYENLKLANKSQLKYAILDQIKRISE
jgi:hypothetical protein